MSVKGTIDLNPIGYVQTESIGQDVRNRKNISHIILNRELTKALEGIEEFSHLYVIFWMHKISEIERRRIKVHPRGRRDMPLLGIFATRTPYRPNPIGLTLIELMKVDGNIITVRGLDAIEGTPILDIKPLDHWDTVKDKQVPPWWKKLENERTSHD